VGYLVTPDGGAPSTLVLGHGTTTVVRGLTEGSSYSFTVAAVTGSGVGPASDPVGPITIGAPATVSNLRVTRIAKGRVKVGFKPGNDNGAAVKKFTATCGTKSASGKVSPLVVRGLKPGKVYTCWVTATNSRGKSAAVASGGVRA
jgi:hypothetical protein